MIPFAQKVFPQFCWNNGWLVQLAAWTLISPCPIDATVTTALKDEREYSICTKYL